jgi:hypothetical protein
MIVSKFLQKELTQILEFYILYLFGHLIFLKFNFCIKIYFYYFLVPNSKEKRDMNYLIMTV